MWWWWWVLVLAVVSVGGREHPQESRLQYARTIASSVLSRTPPGARLIGIRGDLPPLVSRLVHNASTIRQNFVDTFSCRDRVYGYYADQDNDCQIFHICVPMQQLFPDLYSVEDIFHFSFICPGYTIFTQDAMVCAWEDYAFPCSEAHHLYHRNNHFFVVPAEDVQRETPAPSTDTSPTPSPSSSPTPSSSTRSSTRPGQRNIFRPSRYTANPNSRSIAKGSYISRLRTTPTPSSTTPITIPGPVTEKETDIPTPTTIPPTPSPFV